MAYEWVLRHETSLPIPFVVANGTGIEKGALLELQDEMLAILVTGANKPIAGVAAEEKIANDGKTSIGVYRSGIFDAYCSGAATVGAPLCSAASAINMVAQATGIGTTNSGASILGHVLGTAATAEQIMVQLSLGGNS